MGLLGSILGITQGGAASRAVGNANIAAEHGVLDATGTGQQTLADAGKTANTTIQGMLTQQQDNAQPYVTQGAKGEQALSDFALSKPTFDPTSADKFYNDPAYKFELAQGTNAIQNKASASGLGSSGQTLKSLTQYGQGLASTYYQQAFNNAKSTFDTNQNTTLVNLSALAGTGEFGTAQSNAALEAAGREQSGNDLSTANSIANLGLKGATTAGEFGVGAGQAAGAGLLQQGNAWAGLGDSVIGLATGGAGGIPGIGQGIDLGPFGGLPGIGARP